MVRNLQWLKARRKLLGQIKHQVDALHGLDPSLKGYAQSYSLLFKKKWQIANRSELLAAVKQHSVVLGADFHACSQSQRTHLRILRQLDPSQKLVLALECFTSADQKWVDSFVAGQLSEQEFLAKVDWESKWGFPWSYYKPLIELAKQRGFVVWGLNQHFKHHGLNWVRKRDRHAALRLNVALDSYPDHLIYALYGDLHLADAHILAEFKKINRARVLRILQNSEHLYFRLAKKGLEQKVEVMRAGPSLYCILSSPPWVKWQSYLMYLEQAYDHDLDEEEELDYTDHINSFVQFLSDEIGEDIDVNRLAVYSPDKEDALELLEEKMSETELRMVHFLIENDRSFYLPRNHFLYLSRSTINHASSLAGQYIHGQLSDRKNNLLNFPENFEAVIWLEAVGFFFSKLVNHKRKPENLRELRSQLAVAMPHDQGKEALRLALDQRMREILWVFNQPRRRPSFRPRRRSSYLEAAKILGSIMGESLFLSYSQGRLKRSTLVDMLRVSPEGDKFLQFYKAILRRLESGRSSQGLKKKIDSERYELRRS